MERGQLKQQLTGVSKAMQATTVGQIEAAFPSRWGRTSSRMVSAANRPPMLKNCQVSIHG